MHHYLDKSCFCPIAQCGKREMGLEKSWHEYCPTCPLISNSAFPVRSDSKNLPVVPAHTKTRPLSISGLETRGKHSPGAESASLSDANNLWLRFRSRNSHTRALLHRHRSQPCSSSQCPRGSQGGSPAQDTCHDSAICKVQRVPQWHEQWRCQTVSGFSQMGGNTIPERDKCFGSTPNYSLSGRKEGRKAELQLSWACEIGCSSFPLLSPSSEGSWRVFCPQRCKYTLRVSSLISCKETKEVLSKEVVEQQNHLLEASSHTQLILLIFSFLAKGLCEQRLVLREEAERWAKLHLLLLSESKTKSWLQEQTGLNVLLLTSLDGQRSILIYIIIAFPCFPYGAEAQGTWMPPAPLRSVPQTLNFQPSSTPGPSQTFTGFQELCLDPGKNRGSTLGLTECVHGPAKSLCDQTLPSVGCPASDHVQTRLEKGWEAWAPTDKLTFHHPKGWKVCGCEALVPVPYWVELWKQNNIP